MLRKISEGIWKISCDSNIYFLDLDRKILIDTGLESCKDTILQDLKEIVDPNDIDIVILTHFHYDHTGNVDLFPNAKFYCSKEGLKDFEKNSFESVLDETIREKVKKIKFDTLEENTHFYGLKVIRTPGHTRGSICLYLENKKILFSGDTLFDNGNIGRYDLPTSIPEKFNDTLEKLDKYDIKILCPGHDY